MRKNNERIDVEMSLHALELEMAQIAKFFGMLSESDIAYLQSLSKQLGEVCALGDLPNSQSNQVITAISRGQA